MIKVSVTIYRPDMITLEEVVRIIEHLLTNEQIEN
jgi:hypothetical protein